MIEHRLGEISAYCYMVDRGKPAACLAVKEDETSEAIHYVHCVHDLRTLVKPLGYEWKTLWIYKKPFVLELIENAPEGNEAVVHWYWGKLFGYSDESIESYLGSRCSDAREHGSVAAGTGRKGVGRIVKPHYLPAVVALIGSDTRLFSRYRHITTSFLRILAAIAFIILLRRGDIKAQDNQKEGVIEEGGNR